MTSVLKGLLSVVNFNKSQQAGRIQKKEDSPSSGNVETTQTTTIQIENTWKPSSTPSQLVNSVAFYLDQYKRIICNCKRNGVID